MSTLKANNISNNSGGASRSVDEIIALTPRAWVNFNGVGTVAIRASYNVASITDLGTGLYQIFFTNPMIDDKFAVLGTAFFPGSSAAFTGVTTQASNYVLVSTVGPGGSVLDVTIAHYAIMR